MAATALSFAAYKRTGFPEAVTVNCYSEAAPTKIGQPEALLARPGLAAFKQVGTAPIRALFQKDGLFDNLAVIVANDRVHLVTAGGAVTTLTGDAVEGQELVDIDGGLDADYNSVIRIATGDAMYRVSSADYLVVREDFPTTGGAGATSVAFVGGYWLGVEAGSDAMYYQLPAATTWNALQFASAEYAPDPLVAVRQRGDQFFLLGTSTAEGWYLTGNASSPLEPYGGLKFDFGCRARASAVNCKGALIWVDSDCMVRMTTGGDASIISDNGLAEQIRKVDAAELRASFFAKDGHAFYVLTLAAEATWVYDLSTKKWVRFRTTLYDYWRANLFCNIGDLALAADKLSNQIWSIDPDRRTDGDDSFQMEFSAFLPPADNPQPLGNCVLDCELGGSPATGQGSNPIVTLQVSRDDGKTYGDLKQRPLPVMGAYTVKPKWNGLGQTRPGFGAVFKFYISDPVVRRVSGVRLNVS